MKFGGFPDGSVVKNLPANAGFLPLTAGGPGLKHIVWPIEWTSVMAESQPQ